MLVDQANARVAVVDARAGRVLSSVRLEGMPFAIALSPDGFTAYVTESDSVCVIDVRDPLKPAIADAYSNRVPPSRAGHGGSRIRFECAGRLDHRHIGRRP